jgi:hypothetical protein
MHLNEYENNAKWKREAKIIICENQTHFTVADVQYALQLWNKEAKEIFVKKTCNYQITKGVIKIVDAKMIDRSQHWGFTKYTFYREYDRNGQESRVFTGAIIQLDKSVYNIELLVHEMGHAYGYNHYDEESDVMNTITYF